MRISVANHAHSTSRLQSTGYLYVGRSVTVGSLTWLTSCASSSSETQFRVCWTWVV